MNIYVTSLHHRPILYGTTHTDAEVARSLGFDVDLFIHPGGKTELAICLHRHDDLTLLKDWTPVRAEAELVLD